MKFIEHAGQTIFFSTNFGLWEYTYNPYYRVPQRLFERVLNLFYLNKMKVNLIYPYLSAIEFDME